MQQKRFLNALLIGRDYLLAWALPQILFRSGFHVDVISSYPLMRSCRFIRNCDIVPLNRSLLPAILKKLEKKYDWIIVTDDCTLAEILHSDLSVEDKLKLLPVKKKENFIHLFSKIGLSKVLFANGINTPPFVVAKNLGEAQIGASQIGYPVLLKKDSSGGGAGVFECTSPSDFKTLSNKIFDQPILVQKKLSGKEIDLSGLYLEQELIHFSYATPQKKCFNKFGPSSIRTYHPLSSVEENIFHELRQIGKILGAHGFTNLSCIESEGQRFFFEVDMRPNVWVEIPRFFGEDPSLRIQKWFARKEKLSYPVSALPNQSSPVTIPYFLRLKRGELLFNRYKAWSFIPNENRKLIARLIIKRFFTINIKAFVLRLIKRVIPEKHHPRARLIKHRLSL